MNVRLRTFMDWTLNITALACICFMLWHYTSRFFALRHHPADIQVGSLFPIHDLPVGSSKTTLVMVLSTTCPYCRQSEPFYKRLAAGIPSEKTHIVLVFREPVAVARAYLLKEGMSAFTDIRQMDLRSLHVGGTPTLILLDNTSSVRAVWDGVLSETQEAEVLHRAEYERLPAASELHSNRVLFNKSQSVANDINPKGGVILLDMRDRSDFAHGHVRSAYNIPLDELQARAQHELDRNKPIRINCEFRLACKNAKSTGVMTPCDAATLILRRQGFADVAAIDDDIKKSPSANIVAVGLQQGAIKRDHVTSPN